MPLTVQQLQEVAQLVTYKPGWVFTVYQGHFEGPHLKLYFRTIDREDPSKPFDADVHRPIPRMFSEEQFLNWLLDQAIRQEVHEAREFFRFSGHLFSDPHAENSDRDL